MESDADHTQGGESGQVFAELIDRMKGDTARLQAHRERMKAIEGLGPRTGPDGTTPDSGASGPAR